MKVAGIGFRKGATLASLQAALAEAEALGGPVAAIASLPHKTSAAEMLALARARGLPVVTVDDVKGVETPTHSPRIAAMHGAGSVAEATALAAAGPGARITVARLSSPDGMATAAIAESSGDLS